MFLFYVCLCISKSSSWFSVPEAELLCGNSQQAIIFFKVIKGCFIFNHAVTACFFLFLSTYFCKKVIAFAECADKMPSRAV